MEDSIDQEVTSLFIIELEDIGIATTGVAGPNPSAGFEPGIVFVAFASDDHNMCQKLELTGSRADICEQSVEKILQLTLSRLV